MAVLALEMVAAETSGVMYTETPGHPDAGELQIHATWGLGEMLADGRVSSDQVTVRKTGPPAILSRRCGHKDHMMVIGTGRKYHDGTGFPRKNATGCASTMPRP